MPLLLHHQVGVIDIRSTVYPPAQSMPATMCCHHVLHHGIHAALAPHLHATSIATCAQAKIVDILVSAVKIEAAISLPPILHVLSCLARDLQDDFLAYIPRVLASITDLVHSGATLHPSCNFSAGTIL